VLAVAALVLGVHAARYLPFISDDALISLRYAKRLIDGHGLTWNPGERVEGYSNLLWVLSTAALGWLGIDLITSTRILGVAGMVAALAAVVYAYPPSSWSAAPISAIALLFLASSGAMAVWTIGGMEQPLVAALLAWAVALSLPHLGSERASFGAMQWPGLCFGLLCLTRPDAPLFAAAAVLAVVLIGGFGRAAFEKAAALATLPAVCVLGQLAFRLAYYGEWVPNTALVKLSPAARYALEGWRYVGAGARVMWPMLALAAACVILSVRHRVERGRMAFLCALAIAWTAYVIVIGGDIFPAWRHFVPLLVLLALMLANGGEQLRRHAHPRIGAGVTAVTLLLLAVFAVLQWRDPRTLAARAERWEWDGQVIGTLLKKAFGARQPLLAVDAAGSVPYWSELPTVDMLGLNDYYLPRHPPKDSMTIGIGHDLGDGRYVLARLPDLVVFGIATGGDHAFFRSAREMREDPQFLSEYRLVVFEGTEPYRVAARIWVRRNSERIGITRTPTRIVVPGFLINDSPGSVARLAQGGTLILPLSPTGPARLNALVLPTGRWRIEAHTAGPTPLGIKVADWSPPPSSPPRVALDAVLPAVLDWDATAGRPASLEITPVVAAPAELEQLVFTRVAE
jgi:hypothetical protein